MLCVCWYVVDVGDHSTKFCKFSKMDFIPFSIKASDDPQFFEELQEALFLLSALKNSHMFMELRCLGEVEREAGVRTLLERLVEMSH